ncbi:MAG: bifunctional GNAT family N-acetyltransferase/carbon-nitrogen hydrolase family protein [Oligoflexia bacterium]|nr:bifunctional GNAT family N-acetyltransferase/carbon-nitrogen hydrolase family protein [Oligoflexia bacterium]
MAGTNNKKFKVKLRALELADFDKLETAMRESYRGSGMDVWQREQIHRLIQDFPEGQICCEVNGEVAGAALSILVKYDDYGDDHTYMQVTGNYQLNTHNPKGDVLYGIEVFVHPSYRGLRLGRRLYDARKELCENLNLRSIIAGGRIPGYGKVAAQMSPKEYIEKVRLKELYDPILTFQLSNQFHVRKILRNYLVDDQESMQFATLLEWNNVFYEERRGLFAKTKSYARLGLVQWQMRRADKLEDLYEQIEFFVDAVSSLQATFVLFPEFINAPLMMQFNNLPEAEAIRKLAEFTEPLLKKFCEFAVAYNTNIVTGSMPYVEDRLLYSICYLCRRDGSWESYRKIHISPGEVNHWGMVGGEELKAIDTDSGKVGILISDDVEYPELGRLYAEQGVNILFVPFSAATPNDYQRIKCCGQARAIENECYVAIAGSVGNLPKVANMDTQFAQSAVFSPSDFAFPIDSTISEATPNTEMTLVADVDLSLLREIHLQGSSRNLLDRRTDLYSVVWLRNRGKT